MPAIFPIGEVASTFSGATRAFIPLPSRCTRHTSLNGHPSRFGVADGLHGEVPDALALDLFEPHRDIHKHGDQRGGFDGSVPTVDVVGGVGFSDAERLRLLQGFVEAQALLHLAQDHVGGRVENSMKALQVNRGHLVEQRENWDAVHHGGFEEESFALLRGQVAQFAVGMDDGALVSSDGVSSVLEGGADVVHGGLAIFHVEGRGFEEDVGSGGGEPFADVLSIGKTCAKIWIRFRLFAGGGARATYFVWVQALGVGNPSQTARGDAGDAVSDPVAVAQFLGAVFEETD